MDVPTSRLKKILEEFTGEIYQTPPVRASVKRDVRIRNVYSIELLEAEGRNILLKIACQAGTYIRKICFDVGEALGCGAHMRELRRIRAGPFSEEENMVTLHEVVRGQRMYEEQGDEGELRRIIQPVERVFDLVSKIYVRDSAVDALCHGAPLAVPGVVKLEEGINMGDPVAIFTLKGEAVALGEAFLSTEEILEREKGLAANVDRVLLPVGVYPRSWRRR